MVESWAVQKVEKWAAWLAVMLVEKTVDSTDLLMAELKVESTVDSWVNLSVGWRGS